MALYIAHSIFQLARLLYVRPETFGPYYVYTRYDTIRYWPRMQTAMQCFGMHMLSDEKGVFVF